MPFADIRTTRTYPAYSRWLLLGCLALSAAAMLVPASAAAGPRTTSGRKETKQRPDTARPATTRGRKAKKTSQSSMWLFSKPSNVVHNQQGKIVVFTFRNDENDVVSTQVGQLLAARGLEVVPGVRPADTAEQFRDIATHLNLVGYVDGELRGVGNKAKVTVRLRNGYTGKHVTQAVFVDTPDNIPRELSTKLWGKLAPAIAHACSDASKPRKTSRNVLQINAGTPL